MLFFGFLATPTWFPPPLNWNLAIASTIIVAVAGIIYFMMPPVYKRIWIWLKTKLPLELELREEDWRILFAAYGSWADKISLDKIVEVTHFQRNLVSFR